MHVNTAHSNAIQVSSLSINKYLHFHITVSTTLPQHSQTNKEATFLPTHFEEQYNTLERSRNLSLFLSHLFQMHHQHQHQQQDSSLESDPQLPAIRIHHPASPRHHSSGVGATPTPTAGARRKIGVAVDLSDESAYAVRWAVHHYLRPGDAVILLHVSPTSVLFGADWGSIDLSISPSDFDRHPDEVTATTTTTSSSSSNNQKKLEDDFDAFTASKAADLARPLKEAQIPYKIHIVKDHDMKERLCLEVERLGLSAVIMGSRGFGAVRRGNDDGRLGSVSDYCVHHCVCPVVVVRYPEDKDAVAEAVLAVKEGEEDGEAVIKTVPIEAVHEKDA